MAKTFFYACLGLLALVIAFHLGAQVASGQSGGVLVAGGLAGLRGHQCASGVDAGGNIWVGDINGGKTAGPVAPPKIGRIISIEAGDVLAGGDPSEILILYEDGDVYLWYGGPPWIFRTNILSNSPVSATRTTWGRIKAERR